VFRKTPATRGAEFRICCQDHPIIGSALSKFELYFRYSLTATLQNVLMDDVSLQFHIEENDYFGTLATVLDLVSQDLRRKVTSATLKLS
jgi:hypothetical protein